MRHTIDSTRQSTRNCHSTRRQSFAKIIVPIARHTMNAPDSPLRQAEMNATRAVLLQQTVRRGNLSSPEVEEDKIRCPQD